MNKKVFIVSSTPRKGGNSDLLCEEFARGVVEGGNQAEILCLREIELKFCIGCMYCQTHGGCVHKDGANAVLDRVQKSDVLVFATPIYYYEMCGQLKTFLDRMNPLFPRENRFKTVYLLATAADEDASAMDGAEKGIQGWIDCFPNVRFGGVIRGTGVTDKGEIIGTAFMQKAYEAGKNIG